MSDKPKKPASRWLGVIALIVFGALVAWDFSAINNTVSAIIVGIIVAIIFVVVTKAAGIEPGWPKD